jgi:rubrerythrin
MKTVMIKTHEVWLETLMAALMSQTENRQVLFDFSDILFRHFTWLENELIELGESYTYDRDPIPIKVTRLRDILRDIINRLNEIDLQLLSSPDKELDNRIASDIRYMREVLVHMEDEAVTAFDMKRECPKIKLSDEARDALTLFLFEESYKEYELIMIYNYLRAHSDDAELIRVFGILIEESFFHFKRFGDMMAKMGILAVPRVVMPELYQIDDIERFLTNGIQEELAAKEECVRLAQAVADESPELSNFFTFINNQENYHIALMTKALEHLKKDHHG